jgi:hypothetical protein
MARQGGSGDDLTPDPLAPKPGDEGARVIVGILGDGDDKDAVRLYLDLEFQKSYDIPREAIVRREKLAPEQSPLGVESSAIWVRHGTVLKLRSSEARPVEEEFLAGDFTAPGSFSPPAGPGPGGPIRPTIQPTMICPTRFGPCLSAAATQCPTRDERCVSGIVACASHEIVCRTQPVQCRVTVIGCPSANIRCPSVTSICVSRLSPCVTDLWRCRSAQIVCRPSMLERCPSVATICPTPSAVDACPSRFGCGSEIVCGGGDPFEGGGDPFSF